MNLFNISFFIFYSLILIKNVAKAVETCDQSKIHFYLSSAIGNGSIPSEPVTFGAQKYDLAFSKVKYFDVTKARKSICDGDLDSTDYKQTIFFTGKVALIENKITKDNKCAYENWVYYFQSLGAKAVIFWSNSKEGFDKITSDGSFSKKITIPSRVVSNYNGYLLKVSEDRYNAEVELICTDESKLIHFCADTTNNYFKHLKGTYTQARDQMHSNHHVYIKKSIWQSISDTTKYLFVKNISNKLVWIVNNTIGNLDLKDSHRTIEETFEITFKHNQVDAYCIVDTNNKYSSLPIDCKNWTHISGYYHQYPHHYPMKFTKGVCGGESKTHNYCINSLNKSLDLQIGGDYSQLSTGQKFWLRTEHYKTKSSSGLDKVYITMEIESFTSFGRSRYNYHRSYQYQVWVMRRFKDNKLLLSCKQYWNYYSGSQDKFPIDCSWWYSTRNTSHGYQYHDTKSTKMDIDEEKCDGNINNEQIVLTPAEYAKAFPGSICFGSKYKTLTIYQHVYGIFVKVENSKIENMPVYKHTKFDNIYLTYNDFADGWIITQDVPFKNLSANFFVTDYQIARKYLVAKCKQNIITGPLNCTTHWQMQSVYNYNFHFYRNNNTNNDICNFGNGYKTIKETDISTPQYKNLAQTLCIVGLTTVGKSVNGEYKYSRIQDGRPSYNRISSDGNYLLFFDSKYLNWKILYTSKDKSTEKVIVKMPQYEYVDPRKITKFYDFRYNYWHTIYSYYNTNHFTSCVSSFCLLPSKYVNVSKTDPISQVIGLYNVNKHSEGYYLTFDKVNNPNIHMKQDYYKDTVYYTSKYNYSIATCKTYNRYHYPYHHTTSSSTSSFRPCTYWSDPFSGRSHYLQIITDMSNTTNPLCSPKSSTLEPTPKNKITNKPTDKPTPKVTDKPTDKPTDKSTPKVTDKPTSTIVKTSKIAKTTPLKNTKVKKDENKNANKELDDLKSKNTIMVVALIMISALAILCCCFVGLHILKSKKHQVQLRRASHVQHSLENELIENAPATGNIQNFNQPVIDSRNYMLEQTDDEDNRRANQIVTVD